jgi:hypothetical protein
LVDGSVLLGNGNGTFQSQQTFAAGSLPIKVVVADVNGDGKSDVIVDNGGGTVSALLGNGNGTFQPRTSYATSTLTDAIAVGDINGDGKADIVCSNYNNKNLGILLGNGNGTFQTQQTFAAGNVADLSLADVNLDGKLDIVGTNYLTAHTVSVFLGNGNGTFEIPQTFSMGGPAYSITTADVNGDGAPDVLGAFFSGNAVGVLLNNPILVPVNRPITYNVLDNQGEVVRTYQYDGDGISLSDLVTAAATDAVPTADASSVRALTVNSYDDQGRDYLSQTLNIDQSSGTSGLSDASILALPNQATNTFF